MDLREVQDAAHVGLRVAGVDLQRDVGRVVGFLHVVHLLVLVAVVVLPGHDVAQDRRGRRKASGALSEHELPVVALAADHHAVVLVVDTVDVLRGVHELRHDEHREVFVADLHDLRHELDLDVLLPGILDVRIVDRRDAVGEDPLGVDVGAQGVHGDNHQLEERVVSLDVERGVALGESQGLGLRQGVGIGVLVVEDPREDVVRRPVENALHLEQQVVVVILLEVADHGDRAARRGVVEQGDAPRLLDVDQLREVVREHRLVARDDGNAAQQGALDDPVCGLRVVDDLDDQVDVRILEDLLRRGGEQRGVGLDLAGLVRVADADPHDLGMGVLRLAHHFVDALSDDAESEQSDFDLAHRYFVFSRS